MAIVPTMCNKIDHILDGGFQCGKLTELTGESGIGKTQISLQAIVSALLPEEKGGLGGSAVVMTCTTPFPVQRLRQLLSAKANGDLGIVSASMSRIYTKIGSTPQELREMRHEVYVMIKQLIENGVQEKVKIFDIDTIYGFIAHQFLDTNDGIFFRTQTVKNIGYCLGRIAQELNVAVIACNCAVDYFDGRPRLFKSSGVWKKPGIGVLWDKYLHNRYVLSKEVVEGHEGWVRVFNVVEDGNISSRCMYTITSNGVE